jgi:hypothetical protein
MSKGLHPDEIIRWKDGPKYFGQRRSQLNENIRKGLIPAPFTLVEGGRGKGWTGQMILDHHQRRQAAATRTAQKETAPDRG